jgi:hypothetical protein
MPDLASELETLLTQEAEPNLASQVQKLRIIDRCRCGDNFCATFYTVPKPAGAWGPGHRTIELGCKTGMLILDVVNDRITCVEVLDRDDVRRKLHELLP